MSSDAPTRTLPSLQNAAWLQAAETRAVFAALNAEGHIARAVGGAVRNALLGTPVHDVDMATTAPPQDTVRLAERAGLGAIPTGIKHGTVTVISGHQPYEVTTLRMDVETFGRHATVAYTVDWAADARRRDFTINALYCDADGTLHDPLGGYGDVLARRVRFIGEAADRIREDYLRILRFFRFSAEYGEGRLDATGLKACREARDGLLQLSRERVRAELLRLLAAPFADVVVPVISSEFLDPLLPNATDTALLQRLIAIEAALGRAPDAVLRLGALTAARPGMALPLKDALRLSAHEFERLARLGLPDAGLLPEAPEQAAQAFIYRHGAQAFVDGALLAWARSDHDARNPTLAERVGLPERWQPPVLPVRGADVIELGVAPGPRVGEVLSAIEDWWIAAGFPVDEHEISRRLAALARG